MTYLQIVNKVLRLMRQDEIASVVSADDVVAILVTEFVNDAKRYVEDAHNWNSLRESWSVSTSNGTDTYALTNAGKYAKIESIYNEDYMMRQVPLAKIRHDKQLGSETGQPIHWAVNGVDASNDVQLQFYPTPDATYSLTAYGYKNQPDLALDADELLIPAQPVVYRALALALRESGEVGGQTAAEIFMVADQHLSDAIARDADMSPHDFVWYTA